ncbi:hypothetical protein NPIL_161421 [Nephila pilipes]|uniref:Uncharacterized protein n=1 Tax=Nephila pilipes TaxID=299642 RepID=A0A8X6QV91_NEPPI|nr:hypothetical protein NPIL_161421 [Nephila pilipes]
MQFWFRQFRSSILDVKDAPCTDWPIVENVDKITEIIEVHSHVNSRSITQELKIDHKTVLNNSHKTSIRSSMFHTDLHKKHDGSHFHLLSLGKTE